MVSFRTGVWRCGLVLAVVLVATACGDSAEPAAGPTTRRDATTPVSTRGGPSSMQLTSTAFTDGAAIPPLYTCDGEDISPPLIIDGVPDDAAALVLVMDDPDAPRGTWDHWIAFDIPVTASIPEAIGAIGRSGSNSWGHTGYGGPCPPSGTHRYFFRVIATSAELGLPEGADKAAVLDAARSVGLGEAVLMGTYTRR